MADIVMPKFPKPGQCKRKRRQPSDGRLIESPYQYRKTKEEMWRRQSGMCYWCQRNCDTVEEMERHHPDGRGHGGGKRDDRNTVLICQHCHRREHEIARQGRR